ncbi:MAG: hypothetical protein NVSMB32_17650 [Actinomycetota bacterium]
MVTIALVSAAMGAGLLVGFLIGGLVHDLFGAPVELVLVVAAAGSVAGVWLGSWLAIRLTGGNRRRFVACGVGGTLGLVAAVGVAYAAAKTLAGILPIIAILAPGIGAAVGAVFAERGQPQAQLAPLARPIEQRVQAQRPPQKPGQRSRQKRAAPSRKKGNRGGRG